MSRIHFDANVILRFLRNDHPTQSPAAARLFQQAARGAEELFVSSVTINEVFFALASFYKLTAAETARRLLPFVRTGIAEFEHETCLVEALERVQRETVDFGDAWLAAFATARRDQVASFDSDLRKFPDVKLYDLMPGTGN
jgi:predicted nucleic acid-binding protein